MEINSFELKSPIPEAIHQGITDFYLRDTQTTEEFKTRQASGD